MTPDDDVITVYFYLSGTDVLTAAKMTNVVQLSYPLTAASALSPLLSSQTATLWLPLPYISGYSNGQMHVDYGVVSQKTGTRWSNLSPTFMLNTTV